MPKPKVKPVPAFTREEIQRGIPPEAPTLYSHADYEQAAAEVRKAHAAAGYPIDDNGIRRLLVALRGLGLIDWKESPASATMAPTIKS